MGDKEVYKALNADKRKHDPALSLLQCHHIIYQSPLRFPRNTLLLSLTTVNKASSKCQARYAGMKDLSLMFPALRMCFRGGVVQMQLYRVMLHFIRNNKSVHLQNNILHPKSCCLAALKTSFILEKAPSSKKV